MEQVGVALLVAVCVAGGFGWGQWWAERQIRIDNAKLMNGRMQVSMPADPEDAAATLKLLSLLVEQVEKERKAK